MKEDWDTHLGDCVKYDAKDIDPEEEWDAVVIGSGLGGLNTASLLAQKGKKVLVLEQHWTAGGGLHTYESNGYRFSTGMYYVVEMQGGKIKELMVSLTPPGDPVVWDRIQEPIDTIVLGAPSSRNVKCSDKNEYKEYLLENFPNEQKGIEEYFAAVKEAKEAHTCSFLFKCLPLSLVKLLVWTGLIKLFDGGYSKWASITLQQALEKMT